MLSDVGRRKSKTSTTATHWHKQHCQRATFAYAQCKIAYKQKHTQRCYGTKCIGLMNGKDIYFPLASTDQVVTHLIKKLALPIAIQTKISMTGKVSEWVGSVWGRGTPLPPCPFTSLSFPLSLFPFFHLALPIFFLCPSLPFLPE